MLKLRSFMFSLSLLALGLVTLAWTSVARSEDNPSYALHQVMDFVVTADVSELGVKKLEDKAVDTLVRKFKITPAEARLMVQEKGQTDVRRCLQYIYTYVVENITQAKVTGVMAGNKPPPEPVPEAQP